MPALQLDSPLQFVKGVGPTRAQWFAELGLHTVGDLLQHYPFRYELEGPEVEIAEARPGTNVAIRGTVTRIRGRPDGGSFTAELYDGTESCIMRWFHRPYAARQIHVGAQVIASGEVQDYSGRLEMVQPRIEVFPPDATLPPARRDARQVGVYSGTGELKSPLIRWLVGRVLAQPPLIADPLPPELLRQHDFPPKAEAIREMHLPQDDEQRDRARTRLAYEEFLLLELAMALRRRKVLALKTGQKLHVTPEIDRRIRARFPFALTGSQNDVLGEIASDLQSGRPMTRLLQGDVGSGKTVVALYACLVAIANRRQAAIMAPTEILAQQHYKNIEQYLAGSRVRHVLLRGGLRPGQRAETLAAIEAGEIDLVVGTQALIQKDVAFNRLALVVVDEQHKFGVLQRATFRTKGPDPHYLVMTATPIPRTLAMTVFGDLDVSLIRHSPPGRGRTITKVVARRQWEIVMKYVRERLERGEQAYVVCPLIGENENAEDNHAETGEKSTGNRRRSARGAKPDQIRAQRTSAADPRQTRATGRPLVSATQAYDRLTTGPWQGLNVALLHGGMRQQDKDRTIAAFAAGELNALVATTVVEVGVDVPNATIMVIENADHFGLSQLHQLRGRVGRGSRDALCVLIAGAAATRAAGLAQPGPRVRGPESRSRAGERLAVMARTTDGFEIAEADLRQRGPGELFGTRQHGLPELRIGSLADDFVLLEKARRDAFEIVRRDPTLQRPEHQPLLPALRQMFGAKLALIDAA